jgi:hypothetical protein
MTLVTRDPFARTELHKAKLKDDGECDWCGSTGKLYQFSTESDGGRTWRHKGAFCCKSCHDSYHGG